MADDKLATFRCDSEVWEAFKAKAGENDTNASVLLKSFVQAYLDGRIDIKPYGNLDAGINLDERIEAVLDRLVKPEMQELRDRLGKLSAV